MGYGILIAGALLLGAGIGWRFGFSAGRADAERILEEGAEILEDVCEKLEAEGAGKERGGQ